MSSTASSNSSTTEPAATQLVTLSIDGREVKVPKGTNLIEAAKQLGIEIPHYCYHPNLSIAGNCRMCQVEVVGAPKLEIGCNCAVREGMQVKTHHTSKVVEQAQAATLEFILINHPLDCTVCDQAGHCKLQDYHYTYNAKESRFLEEKEHKIKAQPLGPHVMLDGERCILCTRCVRFCDEFAGTGELGVLHRGDRGVITVAEGKELNNPFSGTVVDLCPVGALTHRDWRFNTRIWFTQQVDTICPGCSTGCNVKIATRSGEVVQVKARENQKVNKEWMCDEGRYGMKRFLPESRLTGVISNLSSDRAAVSIEAALAEMSKIKNSPVAVFVSPFLTTEEMSLTKSLVTKYLKGAQVAVGYRARALSELERKLISPDYAPNVRGAVFCGLIPDEQGSPESGFEARYVELISRVRAGAFPAVLVLGDRAIDPKDAADPALLRALAACPLGFGILTDADSSLAASLAYVFAGRSILEKSGVLINHSNRAQWAERSLEPPVGTEPEWRLLNKFGAACGGTLTPATNERELVASLLGSDSRFGSASLRELKTLGVAV